METMLVLGAISALTAASFWIYGVVSEKQKVSTAQSQLASIQKGINSISGIYSNIDEANTMLLQSKSLPSHMISNGTIVNPWKGKVTITPRNGSDSYYNVSYYNVPSSACIDLVTKSRVLYKTVESSSNKLANSDQISDVVSFCSNVGKNEAIVFSNFYTGDTVYEAGISTSVSTSVSASSSIRASTSISASTSASKSISSSMSVSSSVSASKSASISSSISASASVSASLSNSISNSVSASRSTSASLSNSISSSVSTSSSISASNSISMSNSLSTSRVISASISNSISSSVSASSSRSISTSIVASTSASVSSSVSASVSASASASTSASLSVSASASAVASISASNSRSTSASLSNSISASNAISASKSASTSLSTSTSLSVSRSVSASASTSAAISASRSVSTSASLSASRSVSTSVSASVSASASRSLSTSRSVSTSISASVAKEMTKVNALKASMTYKNPTTTPMMIGSQMSMLPSQVVSFMPAGVQYGFHLYHINSQKKTYWATPTESMSSGRTIPQIDTGAKMTNFVNAVKAANSLATLKAAFYNNGLGAFYEKLIVKY